MRFDPRLSGLRGLASSSVVAAHASAALCGAFLFAPLGQFGVALFLALSVYLLVGTLDSGVRLREYFVRRALRIWPLYWATCYLVYLLVDPSLRHLLLNVAFAGIYVPDGQFATGTGWDSHFVLWTLQVEEAAYMAFPLVAKLGARGRRALGLALVASSPAYWAAQAALQLPGFWAQEYTCPLSWTCCYGAGLLALAGLPRLPGWARGLPLALPAWAALGVPGQFFGLNVLCVLPLAALAVSRPPSWLARPAAVLAGESSYALYLTHALLIQLAGWAGLAWSLPAASAAEFLSRPRAFASRVLGRRSA